MVLELGDAEPLGRRDGCASSRTVRQDREPPTTSATMITMRAVPRFTRPILPRVAPLRPVAVGLQRMPSRCAVRRLRRSSRIRRSRRTSIGS